MSLTSVVRKLHTTDVSDMVYNSLLLFGIYCKKSDLFLLESNSDY